ncbi:MAG: hypothetical protein R6U84_10745 [Candidatus Cloacimonadales bacterium]
MKKMLLISLLLATALLLSAQDRLIFSAGYGTADIGKNEHEIYDFRLVGKNPTTIIALNYSYLFYQEAAESDFISERVTDSFVNEVSLQLGRSFGFGNYSSLSLSTGIGLLFLKEEYNNSQPLLPEETSKDFSFPLVSSLYIGLLKNVGISLHAKKSYNDIAEYFSYSIALDLIF